MSENQFYGVADADECPSSGAVDAEGGSPFSGVADVVGVADESPSCGAVVDVVGESPSCDAVDEAPVCCGLCGTALTGAGVVAGGIDQWGSP